MIIGSKSFEEKPANLMLPTFVYEIIIGIGITTSQSSLCFKRMKGLMKKAARGRCCVHKGGGVPKINMKDQQSPPKSFREISEKSNLDVFACPADAEG